MLRRPAPLLALSAGITLLLGSDPAAMAHGVADAGMTAGLVHPLAGIDHLLMLTATGLTAAVVSTWILAWALGGALLGGILGSSGMSVPAAETCAALAIVAAAALSLSAERMPKLCGSVVAGGLVLHGLLHGLEAPKDSQSLLWWGGALLSSTLICAATWQVCRNAKRSWLQLGAFGLMALGALLALLPALQGTAANLA